MITNDKAKEKEAIFTNTLYQDRLLGFSMLLGVDFTWQRSASHIMIFSKTKKFHTEKRLKSYSYLVRYPGYN
jgi:hypothetical protein